MGQDRAEVIAEAVRRQLEGRPGEILEAARERSWLSVQEAMRLAITEQKAYRTS